MAEFYFLDLLGEVAPDLPGVTEPAVVRAARQAARYFCAKTDVLRIETDPRLDVVSGTHTYAITPDTLGRVIVRALEVWVGTDKLVHRSSDQLDRESDAPREHRLQAWGESSITYSYLGQPWQEATGYPPKYYFQERPETIRLVEIPDQDVSATLLVKSSVKPGLADESVDQLVVDNWYETLVLGTRGYLRKMRQKPWTDVNLGLAEEAEFEGQVENVVNERVAGFADQDHAVGRVRAYP